MAAKQGTSSYRARRAWVEEYFDRTAAGAWARLTSDAPVGRVRASVRAGRERMRGTLTGWLPEDLGGRRVLDAGCGPGQLALELARRGATVVAVDISRTLVDVARSRIPPGLRGSVEFVAGDMLDPALGTFDHVVCMDSLIHYMPADAVAALGRLAPRARRSLLFTYAPRTPLLAAMHAIGQLFPRGNRSPAIEPVSARELHERIGAEPRLQPWQLGRTERVRGGFYTSHGVELVRAGGPR